MADPRAVGSSAVGPLGQSAGLGVLLQSLNTINAFTSLISFQCCTDNHLTEFQLTEGKGGGEKGLVTLILCNKNGPVP